MTPLASVLRWMTSYVPAMPAAPPALEWRRAASLHADRSRSVARELALAQAPHVCRALGHTPRRLQMQARAATMTSDWNAVGSAGGEFVAAVLRRTCTFHCPGWVLPKYFRERTGWVLPVPPGYSSTRLQRHGRGPHVVVLSCAGAYVSGAAGSNECPAGSVRIETAAACRAAAAAAGKTFSSVETRSTYPRGCYYLTTLVWFNAHAVGAGSSGLQLLCAAGAPIA